MAAPGVHPKLRVTESKIGYKTSLKGFALFLFFILCVELPRKRTMDMQLVAYLHPTLPWNNLEELSSLWAVFTKCKRQLRNGFRLENMTWRLWYRQAVMQKQNAPPPAIISPSQEDIPVRSLSRSQSLPDLRVPRISKPSEPKPLRYEQPSSPTKFFIDDYDSSVEDDDE
ncbi:hypothetical protein BJV82DRAFT_336840 [Fennellomyces sp. T-0311]|nr:hypothetical protein BJV82DRAFT_336840 [Fennellomyces sp. T-0311]